VVVGSADELKTEAAAQQAVDSLRLTINQQTSRQQLQAISFETLVQHYREHEMPDVFNKNQPRKQQPVEEEGRKSHATQETYEGYLRKWILPRWRSYRLGDVKSVQVEEWLRSLPLAPGSKAKIRNIMSALYSHAIRWEWIRHNPITAVRQSAKRSKVPVILTIDQIQGLLEHLDEPCRTMVLLDASTGLRVGELLGLKWGDVDFEKLEVNVTRSVVKQIVGPCKTEASQKPIPLDAELAEQLWNWRLNTPYSRPEDWVFASPHKGGTRAQSCSNQRECRLAHFQAHVRVIDEGKWRGHQDHPGAAASRQLQGDRRRLHAGDDQGKARGSNPSCQDDSAGKGH
jgi:integrase